MTRHLPDPTTQAINLARRAVERRSPHAITACERAAAVCQASGYPQLARAWQREAARCAMPGFLGSPL